LKGRIFLWTHLQALQRNLSAMKTTNQPNVEKSENRDPITGAPGSHPVGVGVGAASGGAAGAAIGMAGGGPIGAAVGATIGALAGGMAGKGVAEAIDPTAEEAYWRDRYQSEPYYDRGLTYDDYAPAYRTGYLGRGAYADYDFEKAQSELERDYERERGTSRLDWDRAKDASRAAWNRVDHNASEEATRTVL
jgi:hypothetical protein